jgi:hypothetical protein
MEAYWLSCFPAAPNLLPRLEYEPIKCGGLMVVRLILRSGLNIRTLWQSSTTCGSTHPVPRSCDWSVTPFV